MTIVRDIKVAQREGKEEESFKKKVQVVPTPFGAHVEKPDIIKQNRYI